MKLDKAGAAARMSPMPNRKLVLRLCLVLLACVVGAWMDLAKMSPADISALQQRLTDAQCYSGPIDGIMSKAVYIAVSACPIMDQVPIIETGMHSAVIYGVSADRDCKLLATASNDRTVRLWSVPEGRLLRTVRMTIGPEDGGKVFAVAVSPDGSLIAAGGWDARYYKGGKHAISLFDAASGEIKTRIGPYSNVILGLAFSADGRYLAVALAGSQGVRVIDVAQRKEIAEDSAYGERTMQAAFSADGRLFTVSFDGFLRAYDAEFRLINKVKTTGGRQPESVAVDPGGRFLAVGYADSKAVDVYRASDLGREYAVVTSNLTGHATLNAVAWSRDGRKLIAGGVYRGQGGTPFVIWDQPGPGRVAIQKKAAASLIMSIVPCGNGFAFAAADPMLGVLDSDGKVTFNPHSVIPDFSDMGDAFRLSDDGEEVRFSLDVRGTHPMVFDVSRAALEPAVGERTDLAPPRVTGLAVSGWKNAREPKLNGQPLWVVKQEISRSLAIAPKQKAFVLGTNSMLRSIDTQGKAIWEIPSTSEVWNVNVSADGRVAVAAYGDGTIHWYRMRDGEEVLALFVNKDDLRWVAWTPSGYYMASPGGEDMLGWHLNRGWDQAADFFPASRFRERYSRPDIVQRVMVTLDEGKAIALANEAANISADNAAVTSRLPPVIRIVSPADGSAVRDKDISFEYELRSPSGLAVDSVEILIDGRPTRGFKRVEAKADGTMVEHEVVNIPGRDVQIGLIAHAGSLASLPATVRLKWAGEAPSGDDLQKPKLYGVVVGVSLYRDPRLNLHYAAKDAHDFAEALKLQTGGLYRDVELKVLTDADATTAEVKHALKWLDQSVGPRDVGLVFLAGHGITDASQRYYYLDYDSDPNQPADNALADTVLKERTRSIAGKVLVFLDTCHAGQAMGGSSGPTYINKLVEDLSSTDNGVVTFASSTGKQLSLEDDAWNNGAFTKALIEGLPGPGRKGRADIANKGVITTAALDFWLAERVRDLTHGSQSPVMQRPIPDFELFAATR